ncbi:unnamed protein product, partial [Clonostachys rhizophaga]
ADRFVPIRDAHSPLSEKYQTTKQHDCLSASEKLLRGQEASHDPFFSRRESNSQSSNVPRVTSPSVPRLDLPAVIAVRTLVFDDEEPMQTSERVLSSLNPVIRTGIAVDDGHGRVLRSGTHAQLFNASFASANVTRGEASDKYQGCVASALEIDRARAQLDAVNFQMLLSSTYLVQQAMQSPITVLDAPMLRDDFYCSILAYSPSCQTLAIGLRNTLYTWTEKLGGVPSQSARQDGSWITSVGFSSTEGRKNILAIGRSNGSLILKSMCDSLPRFEVQHPCGVACVSWRPSSTLRPSSNPINPGGPTSTKDLIVGDQAGTLFYYMVEWPLGWEVTRDTWPGNMVLIAKISIHSQQICGLAWSTSGKLFASGGNDDLCCLFDVDTILGERVNRNRETFQDGTQALPSNTNLDLGSHTSAGNGEEEVTHKAESSESSLSTDPSTEIQTRRTSPATVRNFGPGVERHCWPHGAAVKAIAFCPWREGLVATGGGSNDQCINFFHTSSGAALATITVSAQVTSLTWSTSKREIAATFGYTQPEHPFRIAVFSWPSCKQVAAVSWDRGMRALYAIPYPNTSGGRGSSANNRLSQGGCLVVASSDKTVKFHEVWSNEGKSTVGGAGTLGSSDILESLEGIDKEGDIIR